MKLNFLSHKIKKSGLKFLALLSILTLGLSGCSEDLDVTEGIKEIPEGTLQLSFAIPDPEVVKTRATEYDINSLEVFIFSKDGSRFLQHRSYAPVSITGEGNVTLPLNTSAKGQEILIYAVANVQHDISGLETVDALRKETLLSQVKIEDGFPMIGSVTVNTAILNAATVSLYRDVAKVSALSAVSNTKVTGFRLYNYSDKAYLGSALNDKEATETYKDFIFATASGSQTESIESTATEESAPSAYVYPSKGVTKEDMNSGVFVVVEINKDIEGNTTEREYYRINLRKADDEGNLEYLNLRPNYFYDITITGFMSAGYSSYEEAIKHPESDQFVTYKIHDHAAEILSMITDGYSELGVTPEVVLHSSTEAKPFVVKLFTPNVNISKDLIEFEVPDWLQVDEGTEHTHSDGEGDYDEIWDADSPGNQYEFNVSINSGAKVYEDRMDYIIVKWKGTPLTRKIKVTFESALELLEVCTATLTIKENGSEVFSTIKSYWNFVRGEGKSSTSKYGTDGTGDNPADTPQLFGIDPDNQSGGKKRNNGLHFPMPYGDDFENNPWTYEYTIDFTKLDEETDDAISKIEAKFVGSGAGKGKEFIEENFEWEYTDGQVSGKLKMKTIPQNDQYQYAVGKVIFTISYSGITVPSEVEAALYHTGFFHYEGSEVYAPASELGYYYYEVVPMADGHWLDRNIGANGSTSYIDTEDADSDKKRQLGGRHYTITKELQDFKLPDFDLAMCPPGYHIPNTTEFDALRTNEKFVTRSVTINGTLYMSTFYETGDPNIGNVYMQKARFENGKNIYDTSPKYSVTPHAGDAGAGYYWTISAAPAMEKEHMGNWLRALYLNGSSSTYNNASVTDHRMPIRCKAGKASEVPEIQENYISFNVHEVTHIYLFDKETGKALYTFPGKAVGTSESAVKWQHFYCSTTMDPEDLLMLFVKLDNGKVSIYRKYNATIDSDIDAANFVKSDEFRKEYLNENYAWKVESGKFYDFCEKGAKREEVSECETNNVLPSEPDDCDTGTTVGGGGGGSQGGGDEQLTGDYSWEEYQQLWHDAWQNLGYGQYDWSKVKEGSKIIIVYDVYNAQEAYLKFMHATPSWGLLKGTNEIKFQENNERLEYTLVLTQEMIDDLVDNGGLVIQGYQVALRKVAVMLAQ